MNNYQRAIGKSLFVKYLDEIKEMIKRDTVYCFYYNFSKCESAPYLISIHNTKAGAYKAMRKHIVDRYMLWYNDRIKYGKSSTCNFSFDEDWFIKEEMLMD